MVDFRIVIHRKGNQVKIFTEDKRRDIASNLPGIVEDMKKLYPNELIFDTETVWHDQNGIPLPRHKMMAIIAGKKPLTGEDIRANVFDILYYKGIGSLANMPWSERQTYLRKVLGQDTPHIKRVVPIIAKTDSELRTAIQKTSKQIGSEGSMLKRTNSIYSLSGYTKEWCKLKIILEITLKVIGIRQKRLKGKPINTFLYRGAFLNEEGKLQPMESQHILAPADMQEESEWDMGAGFARRKPSEYGYGETYGTSNQAKIGDFITVAPIHILEFKGRDDKNHWAWMFPRFRNIEPDITKPASVTGLRKLIKPELRMGGKPEIIFPLRVS